MGPQTYASAGTLSLSIGSTTMTATPTAQNVYLINPISFAPGDVLGVSGSGGDVPAFAEQTITSPGKIVLSPALPSTISTSQDLTFTWTGGEAGATVTIGVARAQPNAQATISCNFEATAGTGTVLQAQLAVLQSGSPNGSLFVGQWKKTTFAAGSFVIDLSAAQQEDAQITFQ